MIPLFLSIAIDLIILFKVLSLFYLELIIFSLAFQVINIISLLILLLHIQKKLEDLTKLNKLNTVYMMISYFPFVFFISESIKIFPYIKKGNLFSLVNILLLSIFILTHFINTFLFHLEFILVKKTISKILINEQIRLIDLANRINKSGNPNEETAVSENEPNGKNPIQNFKKDDTIIIIIAENKKEKIEIEKKSKEKIEENKEKNTLNEEEDDKIGYNKKYSMKNEILVMSSNRGILNKENNEKAKIKVNLKDNNEKIIANREIN